MGHRGLKGCLLLVQLQLYFVEVLMCTFVQGPEGTSPSTMVYGLLSCQQVNMFFMLYFFGYFMRQDLVYTSFGFHDGHPTVIGLFLVSQFIFSPYYQV